MRSSIMVLFALVAAVVALPAPDSTPTNGEVVSTCDDTTDLGVLTCLGTGFTTCTHRGNIFRDCGAGTTCQPNGDSIQCL